MKGGKSEIGAATMATIEILSFAILKMSRKVAASSLEIPLPRKCFSFFHSALQVRAVAESIRVFILFIADCFILQCFLRAKYQAKW